MTRHSRTVPALLIAAALTLPSGGQAQAFKVARFNIGGDGGTDYLTAEPGTGRVFVSRGTHVMVVDGATGKVLGDIPDTPRTHGIALVPPSHHGFITNGGDSTVTMFDLDRKSTRLNSSHLVISYAVFCLKKKKTQRVSRLPDCRLRQRTTVGLA